MSASINAKDLTPDQRVKFGIHVPAKKEFTALECRSWSLKVLASMAKLSQRDRERVLTHALRVNAI